MDIKNAPPYPPPQIYTGVTDTNGEFSIVYNPPKQSVPYVAPVLNPTTDPNVIYRLTASDVNGFTVKVEQRTGITVLGLNVLSLAVTNTSGQQIQVLVS